MSTSTTSMSTSRGNLAVVFDDDRGGAVDVGVHVGVAGLEVLPHEELVLGLDFFFFEREKVDGRGES